MRNITTASLAKLNSQYGIESLVILQIEFPSGSVYYGEKEHSEYGIEGRILTTGGIDDVVGLAQSGSSKSVTFSLSDHDGALKNIFDYVDLHAMPCKILQWFEGIPFSEAFVLFDGVINTPISWNEGTRTLDLTVMTLLENREVGFSPDESYFNIVGHNLMGQAWPIIFGKVIHSPLLRVHETPTILVASGFSIVDEKIWNLELADLEAQAEAARKQALAAYLAGLEASHTAATYIDNIESSHTAFGGPGVGGIEVVDNPPDDYQQYLSYNQQSNGYYKQYTDYSNQYVKIQNEIAQKSNEFRVHKSYMPGGAGVNVISPNVPRGVPLIIEIGDNQFHAVLEGAKMFVGSYIKPPRAKVASFVTYQESTSIRTWQGEKNRQKFEWIPGGTRIKVINLPINYILSLGTVTPIAIYGKQQGAFVPIPSSYYSLQQTPFTTRNGETVYATTLTMNRPLSLIANVYNQYLWDSDDIYADIQGSIPGRLVDILEYIITTYTSLDFDPVSFAATRLYTDAIPMNHALRSRVDALQYLEQLAFQGKCALWIKENVVYIRYLPVEPPPVDTISRADILEDSLEIFSTDTEAVITKYIAKWKFTEDQPEDNEIVYRYNLAKYYLHEDSYTFFAFNDPGSVGWSAIYWSIIKATVFKKIKFKTDLTKLNLESFDAVTVDLVGIVANETVTGIVESAVYNSDAKEIDFVVWLPVRLGEMYHWIGAYPATTLFLYGEPSDAGIYTGNPFEKMHDPLGFLKAYPNPYNFYAIGALPPLHGIPYPSEQTTETPLTVDTTLMNVAMDVGGPVGIDLDTANDYNKYEVKPITPVPLAEETPAVPYFGTIVKQSDTNPKQYTVQIFGSTRTVKATQMLIGSDSPPIPKDTPVILLKITGQYYFQSPVWLMPPETP